ncbi:MAG TPA: hypothetical protein EYQ31_02575 [Candidatus Handelsmanbacteria bacterium]|nr:hypothetical protein [Candidatus Handelsmanbacteria bacterium]
MDSIFTADVPAIGGRREVAGQCEQNLQYGIRTYVDEMGHVVYAGGPGPDGFVPAELQQALNRHLQAV